MALLDVFDTQVEAYVQALLILGLFLALAAVYRASKATAADIGNWTYERYRLDQKLLAPKVNFEALVWEKSSQSSCENRMAAVSTPKFNPIQ